MNYARGIFKDIVSKDDNFVDEFWGHAYYLPLSMSALNPKDGDRISVETKKGCRVVNVRYIKDQIYFIDRRFWKGDLSNESAEALWNELAESLPSSIFRPSN